VEYPNGVLYDGKQYLIEKYGIAPPQVFHWLIKSLQSGELKAQPQD